MNYGHIVKYVGIKPLIMLLAIRGMLLVLPFKNFVVFYKFLNIGSLSWYLTWLHPQVFQCCSKIVH